MRTDRQRTGDDVEDAVVGRLHDAGWLILGRQVRVGRSELDIVGVDPGPPPALVIVEVRFRSRRDFGVVEESLGTAKRRALSRAVAVLLSAGRLADGTALPRLPIRVDLVAIDKEIGGATSLRHHRGIALSR